MDSGIEFTLSRFTNGSKLCGAVNMLEGRDAIQDPSKVQETGYGSSMQTMLVKSHAEGP